MAAALDPKLEALKGKAEAKEAAKKQFHEMEGALRRPQRLKKQKAWRQQLHRMQQYLGMPAAATNHPVASLGRILDPTIVFIGVDVEAWERDQDTITEIGISTLFLPDIINVSAGPNCVNYHEFIRSRHLRIRENVAFTNVIVENNAESFAFGQSEVISLAEVVPALRRAFNTQYQAKNILVVHNKNSEIKYLTTLGFEVAQHVQDCIDSSDMFQVATRDGKQASLINILLHYDLAAECLHNAGNDARYTLHAVLAIAADQSAYKKTKEDWEAERQNRMTKAIEEAMKRVDEQLEGWSAAGEENDGDGQKDVASVVRVLKDKKPESSRGGMRGGMGGGRGGGRGRPRGMARGRGS